jgi:hypothetical protein
MFINYQGSIYPSYPAFLIVVAAEKEFEFFLRKRYSGFSLARHGAMVSIPLSDIWFQERLREMRSKWQRESMRCSTFESVISQSSRMRPDRFGSFDRCLS